MNGLRWRRRYGAGSLWLDSPDDRRERCVFTASDLAAGAPSSRARRPQRSVLSGSCGIAVCVGQVVLLFPNACDGGKRLSGKTLEFVADALGSESMIVSGTSMLRFAAFNVVDISPRLTPQPGVRATFDTNKNAVTFRSAFTASGNGPLSKSQPGTLAPAAVNAFSAGVRLDQCVLEVRHAAALGDAGSIRFGGELCGTSPV